MGRQNSLRSVKNGATKGKLAREEQRFGKSWLFFCPLERAWERARSLEGVYACVYLCAIFSLMKSFVNFYAILWAWFSTVLQEFDFEFERLYMFEDVRKLQCDAQETC